MQKCKDIFSFSIQKKIVFVIKYILSRNELCIATDRPQVSCICKNGTEKAKHCRDRKKKGVKDCKVRTDCQLKIQEKQVVHHCPAVHQMMTLLRYEA